MEQEGNDLWSGNRGDSLSTGKVLVFSCPFLGTLEDSDTSLAFPNAANHCYRVESPAEVDLSHQEAYCLTDRHPDCHVFQKGVITTAVPERESADSEPEEKQRRRVSLYALPLILILILLAAIVWWPAPGSNIQETLVFADQAQEETIEETSLTDDNALEPGSQTSPVEVESSSTLKDAAPAVSPRESPTQKEEETTTSTKKVENAAGDEGVQTEAPPEADNPANPAVQAQATGATGTTVRSPTESGESPSESPETETMTLAQPASSTELDVSTEAKTESPESSASDLEPSIETASVDKEAPSTDIQDAAVAADSEEVEQTAETEDASASVSITDLPIIAADLATVTTPAVESTDSSTSNEQVIIVKSAFVDVGALNLRAGPGVEFEPITIINSGELVGLLGRLSSGPWVRIRLDNGVEGWVNSLLLTQGN